MKNNFLEPDIFFSTNKQEKKKKKKEPDINYRILSM